MTEDERITTPDKRPEDIDAALRPKTLAEFIGQAAARDNLRVFIEAAKGRGVWCYGAAMEGAAAWTEPDYSGGVAIVLGAEGKGLRPRVAAACDQLIALPLRGRIDSLNVSAAAAALLYEVVRTRG